jgi:hypothetical protein
LLGERSLLRAPQRLDPRRALVLLVSCRLLHRDPQAQLEVLVDQP